VEQDREAMLKKIGIGDIVVIETIKG